MSHGIGQVRLTNMKCFVCEIAKYKHKENIKSRQQIASWTIVALFTIENNR